MVWTAWGITFGMVICLTIYACITKSDMTMKGTINNLKLGGLLFIIIIPLFSCIFMSIFYPRSETLAVCIICLVIIFYGFYLIWET